MKTYTAQSGFFNPRALLAIILCAVGVFLAALGFASTPTPAGWSLVTSPNTSATQSNYLNNVACASTSDCWAVGSNIQHWDGTSWAIVTSPAGATSVTCASASECWAVGSYNNGTLIERWDGTSWVIVSSPNSGTLGNALYGVTCASASDCWAVGSYIITNMLGDHYAQTLVERWNGTSWSIVPSPNNTIPPGYNCELLDRCYLSNSFQSVACASASDCWAVGSDIGHWDGSSWAMVSPNDKPNFGENLAVIEAVTCSASDCWAVGYYNTGGEENYALIEQWNGSAWVIASSPNPGFESTLFGVTCVAASQCWAAGYYGNGVVAQTLIEKWDGSSWSIAPSPNTSSTQHNYLYGVACPSASQCWTVGYSVSSNRQTLIEEYAPTIPPLVGVVSRMTHGSGAGTFDINLPLIGTRGVECRSSAFFGGGNYTMIFSLVNNVTSCGTASTGLLSSGPGSNQCTVNLTGVTNQQNLTVTLNNVLDSQTNTGNVAATMGVLVGDTTGNGSVNSSDISQTKGQSGTPANSSNFRTDVTASGLINSSDISTVKSKSGTALP